jgi:hypothetical protein
MSFCRNPLKKAYSKHTYDVHVFRQGCYPVTKRFLGNWSDS